MADITTLSDQQLEQALGYNSGADITKVSDADLMKAVAPADASPQMQDAQWGVAHPYLRAAQNTANQAIVNPIYQAAKAVTPAVQGIEKNLGVQPNPNAVSSFIPPDMSNAPFAARVLGDIGAGAGYGAGAALISRNPIAGFAGMGALSASGNNQNPVGGAITGAASAIPQMIAGKLGSTLASSAAKPFGGMIAQYAPNVGTALGMGGANAVQAKMSGQNPMEAAATGATFGLMSPMNPIGAPKVVSQDEYDAELDKGAATYRNVLNPGKGIINKVEIKSDSDIGDSMRLAAQSALPIASGENSKGQMTLDNRPAIDKIAQITTPMYDMQNKILAENPAKQFSIQDLADEAKGNIDNPNHPAFEENASDAAAAKSKIQNEADAEILRHGENVDGQTLNMIKQGLWGKSYNPLEPNGNDGARALGFAAKNAIEQAYPDDTIVDNNEKIGKYLQLKTILEKTHGQVVQGGKLGNQVAGGVGALAGVAAGHILPIPIVGEAIGGAVGYHAGESANKFLNDPARITRDWAKHISNFKVNNPEPITPQVMDKPKTTSMNPILGISKQSLPAIGYDQVGAYGRERMSQEQPGLVTPVSRQSGMPINQPPNPGALAIGQSWQGSKNETPQPLPNTHEVIQMRGASNKATNPINFKPKTTAENGPLQPNLRAQSQAFAKGGTPEGVSEPIVTPAPGTPEHQQTFPQSNINPLANVQKGSANDPLGKKIATATLVGTIGMASVFNPINAQAKQVQNPDNLNLTANQYIMKNEGWKAMPYMDTNGNKTVGYGFKEGGSAWKYIPDAVKQGRRSLTKQEGMYAFNKAYPDAVESASKFAGDSWNNLSVNQQKALIDMSYQMGSLHFPKLKLALEQGNYNTAAKEILNSKYAKKDAPNRALQNAVLMQS